MNKLANFSNLLRNKKDLMGCIFLTLIIQIAISAVIIMLEQKHKFILNNNLMQLNQYLLYFILLIIGVVLVLTIGYTNLSFFIKQILFFMFSVVIGITLSISMYNIEDKQVITSALIATLANFGLLFLFGLLIVYFGYDLGWMGVILLIALLIVIVYQLVNIFALRSTKFNKLVAVVVVILFSLFILYDTNNILLKYENSKNNCIMGALDYYLDILNLFTGWTSFSN
tara:strand:- start:1228 stop:1908 length:681 start_codon:yes stop_codon:yes gene_type:complete